MLKSDMTKYCTAAALAVRTFITGSSNLLLHGPAIEQIAKDLGLRPNDITNIMKTRGSWLGVMVDFLGIDRVTAVYQLIHNRDIKPPSWGEDLTEAQKSALNIQKHADVYAMFKAYDALWNGGANPHPTMGQAAGVTNSTPKQQIEAYAVRTASNATGNCGETSLLGYLLLSTLPKDGKFKAAYAAASNLTVGLYEVIDGDHSYVITSNDGYAPDKDPVNFCVCDPWLGCAFSNLQQNLHYKGNVINITLSYEVMPEIKVGSYQFASISSDLSKFKGVMQILHSAFLTEFEKLQALQ